MKRDERFIKLNVRGIEIPLYNQIINLGLSSFEATARLIDKIAPKEREWEKGKVLVNDHMYMTFLQRITNASDREIVGYFNDFCESPVFKEEFQKKLELLGTGPDWGTLTFHSLTIYVVIRAISPDIAVETGVASGKSTAMILYGMHHNHHGRLISIDLPNVEGRELADGSKTTTYQYETGWLVPDFLRDRWTLKLGNSVELLPEVMRELEYVDIFFHDSLHTYEHVSQELAIVSPKMRKGGAILVDDIGLGAGEAFNEFLKGRSLIGYAYRDFGAALLR